MENQNYEEQEELLSDDEMSFFFDANMFENSNQKEEEEDETPPIVNHQTQTVSGIGIHSFYDDGEEKRESLDDIIKSVNAGNSVLVKEENERLKQEQQAFEEQERKIREEAQARRLKEISESERLVREEMERKEAEEERRLAEELEAKRKANPFYKIKDIATNVTSSATTAIASKASQIKNKETKKQEETKETKEETAVKNENEVAENEAAKKKPVDKKDTEQKKAKKEKPQKKSASPKEDTPDFEYLATHDSLTKMKNSTAYDIDIKNKEAKNLAILFFDINDLKETNDTMGHSVGNKLIITVANGIEQLFPRCGYRIGGDEFVVLLPNKKKSVTQSFIEGKIDAFQKIMVEASKQDPDNLKYSVSIGFAIGEEEKSIEELKQEADMAMYANKKAYKQKNGKVKEEKKKPEEEKRPPADHDSLLSEEQRMLKGVIQDNHTQVSEESTEKIIREIQSHYDDIIAILIASPSFDHLFIVQSVDVFLNLVASMSNLVDYSYLYVVYENGTQFYGVDEYFDEVTELFKEIGQVIKTNSYVSDKELLKIKGINIFKQIYFD